MSNIEHLDVLVVGAGISGIGAGCHLSQQLPGKSYAILEARDAIGGTWDLFRYPGIRSDSDLFTFGYKFKPWEGDPIAVAPEILRYLRETVEEQNIADRIRFGHKVLSAAWSTQNAQWLVTVQRNGESAPVQLSCNFLWMCPGYYRYDKGYTPEFPGLEQFEGDFVHPQEWPEDLDYKNKKVVVIGSGATAVTIIPSMAEDVEHITMLQRSPSFISAMENSSELADSLRRLDVPADWIHEIARRDILEEQRQIAEAAKHHPDALRAELKSAIAEACGDVVDVEKHFNPSYNPWDERLCLAPNGDIFDAFRSGKASVVTDQIESFTKNGIKLKSGEILEADIIVSATGLNLCAMGDVEFSVDGKAQPLASSFTYHGMMFSDLPNLAYIFGYIRTSWTMRSDMVAEFVCRVLKRMSELGVRQCTPRLRPEDDGMAVHMYISEEEFSPGYMQRGIHLLPRQGDRAPWINSQNYYEEKDTIPALDLNDGALVFENPVPDTESAAAG